MMQKQGKKLIISKSLILNKWLFSLFGANDLQELKEKLYFDECEAQAGEPSNYFAEISNKTFLHETLQANLQKYDANILNYWEQITQNRHNTEAHQLKLKYFQYLALLFTEIYLDWYFNKPQDLLEALNDKLKQCKQQDDSLKDLPNYQFDELNKLAFWMATGAGKTLLMHINILQFKHYSQNKQLDNIILLTPREGLSTQHELELKESGFDRNYNIVRLRKSSQIVSNSEFRKNDISIMEITSLISEKEIDEGKTLGEKTKSTAMFEGYNLVLVDEGHSGASSEDGKWLKRREEVSAKGFVFEYSATFGQAVAGGEKGKKELFNKYAKSILFDYSYKFFYKDGFGKESLILNLQNKTEEYFTKHQNQYFTACLLSFYQQLYLFAKEKDFCTEYNIEKPLMVFIGHTVSGGNERENSDIIKILNFINWFTSNKTQVIDYLHQLLTNNSGLLNSTNNENIFYKRFTALEEFIHSKEELYTDILQKVFNSSSPDKLYLSKLAKADGEIALQLGHCTRFGVINIGNVNNFEKALSKNNATFGFITDEIGQNSLFHSINKKHSEINILIGSRKFTEGWSSWRVSTMGLLNMGKSEGTQIIQLFGRGVRLKGKDFSLKRSKINTNLKALETLNIFGLNADYMDTFKKYLIDEGLNPDKQTVDISFKVQISPSFGNANLRTIKLYEEYQGNKQNSFKKARTISLFEIPKEYQNKIKAPKATLDAYPRLEVIEDTRSSKRAVDKVEQNLKHEIFDLFDWDKIYLELQAEKRRKGFYNLQLDQLKIKQFVTKNKDWYSLFINSNDLKVTKFADIKFQQDKLIELLKKYMQSFYDRLKSAYEGSHYKTKTINSQDPAFNIEYKFTLDSDDPDFTDIANQILTLQKLVERKDLTQLLNWQDFNNGLQVICLNEHLFFPLIGKFKKDSTNFNLEPSLLDAESEMLFLNDLKQALQDGSLKQVIGDKEIYLLRNLNHKKHGVGFALAGSFFPDFLLWLVDKSTGKQFLTFVDPKGLRQLNANDAKFDLPERLKEIKKESKLDINLNSFILSSTPKLETELNFGKTSEQLAEQNIIFMEDEDYLTQLFTAILEKE